ncbi:hypothetical protein JW964_08720 [candidate division KSB1 bacterium]|nr:hypothetical protein [candidate division KSB1 bacterium]
MKKIKFNRIPNNPIIPRTPGTFYSIHAANPDLLQFSDKYLLYFRGQDESRHDQLGVASISMDKFDGIHWEMFSENPIVKVGAHPDDFDSGYILDPATIVINDQVYIYYTAHSSKWNNWNIPSYVGLAISDDGFHFQKSPANPILHGTQPEIVFHQGLYYLLYQRKNKAGYFDIYCCPGKDGIHFSVDQENLVFGPAKQKNAFDSYSISTVRLWQEDEWFYMFYGGSNRYFDYPTAFGLARSRNLLNWERYPHNPVFERGEPGTWDEGAIWFATVFKKDGKYYLWYEGTGSGMGLGTPEAREASRLAREGDYGGYANTSFSQVGLAVFEGELLLW